MNDDPQRIYLDNAATSWPKPAVVVEAMRGEMEREGGAAGRGGHRAAERAAFVVQKTRESVARLMGTKVERVVFCQNGTEALNLVILGFVRPRDHVVLTQTAHNSVLRPLHHLREKLGVRTTLVPCDSAGRVDPVRVIEAVESQTRLVILNHVSNVTGAIEPIDEVTRALVSHPAAVLVDAAQSLGHLDLDLNLKHLPIDFLASSGHKGLLGPLGTGVVVFNTGLENEVTPLRFGGTGSSSDSERQPDEMPAKYEAGNLNVPALAGLGAGVEFLLQKGVAKLREQQATLANELRQELSKVSGVRLIGPELGAGHCGPISFVVEGFDSREFAAILDGSFGLQLRAGFHCAALIHDALETRLTGGTVRACPGPFTTHSEIEHLVEAIKSIVSAG